MAKSYLWVFVNCLIENPAFDSQAKETMTLLASGFGSTCPLSDGLLKKFAACGVVDSILRLASFRADKELKKGDGAKRSRLTGRLLTAGIGPCPRICNLAGDGGGVQHFQAPRLMDERCSLTPARLFNLVRPSVPRPGPSPSLSPLSPFWPCYAWRAGIPKLDDANDAGGRNSIQCTLILTEGDSAKTLAIAGLGVVGRDKYGVFPLRYGPRTGWRRHGLALTMSRSGLRQGYGLTPGLIRSPPSSSSPSPHLSSPRLASPLLRGKLLNVRDAGTAQITGNAEIQNIKQILGLQHGKVCCVVSPLRWGISSHSFRLHDTTQPMHMHSSACWDQGLPPPRHGVPLVGAWPATHPPLRGSPPCASHWAPGLPQKLCFSCSNTRTRRACATATS